MAGQCSMEGVYVFAPLFNRLSKGIVQREFKVKICLQGYHSKSTANLYKCTWVALLVHWARGTNNRRGVCRSWLLLSWCVSVLVVSSTPCILFHFLSCWLCNSLLSFLVVHANNINLMKYRTLLLTTICQQRVVMLYSVCTIIFVIKMMPLLQCDNAYSAANYLCIKNIKIDPTRASIP